MGPHEHEEDNAGRTDGGSRRDLLLLGGSAGALGVVKRVLSELPADLSAAVLVCLHRAPGSASALEHVLARAGPLPVERARDGARVEPGRVLVAAPDRHLLLVGGRARLARGPKENRSRPAIDALFRSAAVDRRERAVGLLLPGMLDDGVAGLAAVRACGGATLVVDPAETSFPDMPSAALEADAVDRVVATDEAAAVLLELTASTAPPPADVPENLRREVRTEHGEAVAERA